LDSAEGCDSWSDSDPMSKAVAHSTEEAPMSAPTSRVEIGAGEREWLVAHATRAPSVHNTQPWRFRWSGNVVDIGLDLHRGLVSSDPMGREAVISCGAALFQLRLALRQLDLVGVVEAFPDHADPRKVARVTVTAGPQVSQAEQRLFTALKRRHTHRGGFDGVTITPGLAVRLQEAAFEAGAQLIYVSNPGSRQRVLELARAAERLRSADPGDRDETEAWTPPPGSARRDGVPARAYVQGRPATGVDELAGRDFDLGRDSGRLEQGNQPTTPIAVLVTEGDGEPDWLRAGEALSASLLTAAAEWSFAFIHSRVTEVPALREELRRELGTSSHPQLLLRFGYAQTSAVTPRRSPEEVIDLS
jgi:hypothetical protein